MGGITFVIGLTVSIVGVLLWLNKDAIIAKIKEWKDSNLT